MASQVIRGTERRGIAFPIEKGREGYWTRKNASALRRTSMIMILGTSPGERVGVPEFGSRLRYLTFEPNDTIMLQQLQRETAGALSKWDPYLKIVGVATEAVGNAVSIFIDYVDLADEAQTVRRLTYTIPKSQG